MKLAEDILALTLRFVDSNPRTKRIMEELLRSFTVAEMADHLVLTAKEGKLKLFLRDLDDLDDVVSRAEIQALYGKRPFPTGSRSREQSKSEPDRTSALDRRVSALESQIECIRMEAKALLEQRDEWKRRALKAETENSDHPAGQAVNGRQYSALKRQLAKMLHPDNGPDSPIEKMIREAMFKEIWAEVEKLDRLAK